MNIGRTNQEAVEQILSDLRIPVVARDLGGETGRHVTLDTATGLVLVRAPGAGRKSCKPEGNRESRLIRCYT